MRDFLDTAIPFWKSVVRKVGKRLNPYHRFRENLKNNNQTHSITKRYQKDIKDALAESENIQETVEHILGTLTRLISIYNLNDENNEELLFNQIIFFMNYLYLLLRSKYIFNTINKNDLKEFNEKTIWDKIGNLIQKEWDSSYSWCCCIHYALLFKHIFDELEKRTGLGISSYLYLEKAEWLNHAWVFVTFKWENYLLDSSFFNQKFMQPVDELWKWYDRMEPISQISREDIPDEPIDAIREKYGKYDHNWHKIAIKSSDDLLSLLESAPIRAWSFSKMYNVYHNTFWVNLRIFSDWIILLDTFVYRFDHVFTKEELDNLSDSELMNLLANSISYKTKKYDNKKIKVFNFEKNLLQDSLSYFSDKVDYPTLRKILSWD